MEEKKKSVAPKATATKKASAAKAPAKKAAAASAIKPVAAKKPAVKKPAAKAPVAVEAPALEKPVVKKPALKKPALKKEEAKVEVKPVVAEPLKSETTKPVAKAEAKAKPEAPKAEAKVKVANRLKEKFDKVITANLIAKYGFKSAMQVPHLEKVVINIGVGDAIVNSKLLDDSVRELGEITGQRPIITKAKKSIANFKLREGQAIGCKVTLRGMRMYDFLDKLVSIALPRVRDFRGVSRNAFDGHGNYTLGVKEQLIFPEIDYDKVNKIRGMDIVIVTTAKDDDEAFTLLSELGMPFRK